jgi:hypothetical protein
MALATGGTLWAQYTFQFAHEFMHVLCSYDDDPHKNKWFEESVCETSSLFVLRRSAETWKTAPPYDHWKDYARHLKSYADDRMESARLPKGKTFLRWYKENREALRRNATDRPKNNIVAGRLLPLLEEEPRHWEATTWLNQDRFDASTSFEAYLKAWQKNCPDRHKDFVRRVASLFGVRLRRGPRPVWPKPKK